MRSTVILLCVASLLACASSRAFAQGQDDVIKQLKQELQAVRKEVQQLRDEIKELRQEVRVHRRLAISSVMNVFTRPRSLSHLTPAGSSASSALAFRNAITGFLYRKAS